MPKERLSPTIRVGLMIPETQVKRLEEIAEERGLSTVNRAMDMIMRLGIRVYDESKSDGGMYTKKNGEFSKIETLP